MFTYYRHSHVGTDLLQLLGERTQGVLAYCTLWSKASNGPILKQILQLRLILTKISCRNQINLMCTPQRLNWIMKIEKIKGNE